MPQPQPTQEGGGGARPGLGDSCDSRPRLPNLRERDDALALTSRSTCTSRYVSFTASPISVTYPFRLAQYPGRAQVVVRLDNSRLQVEGSGGDVEGCRAGCLGKRPQSFDTAAQEQPVKGDEHEPPCAAVVPLDRSQSSPPTRWRSSSGLASRGLTLPFTASRRNPARRIPRWTVRCSGCGLRPSQAVPAPPPIRAAPGLTPRNRR